MATDTRFATACTNKHVGTYRFQLSISWEFSLVCYLSRHQILIIKLYLHIILTVLSYLNIGSVKPHSIVNVFPYSVALFCKKQNTAQIQ